MNPGEMQRKVNESRFTGREWVNEQNKKKNKQEINKKRKKAERVRMENKEREELITKAI